MIKIKNLDKSFGELHVLKNVSLEVQKGEIFGLIGKSGEGKQHYFAVLTFWKNGMVGPLL